MMRQLHRDLGLAEDLAQTGGQRFLDLHLVMPKDVSVERAHELCDHLEHDISEKLPDTSTTIHVEPCDTQCEDCPVDDCKMPGSHESPAPLQKS